MGEKTKEKKGRVLKDYYMTTELIAQKWNSENFYKNSNKKSTWEAEDISKKFSKILSNWEMQEELEMYKSHKSDYNWESLSKNFKKIVEQINFGVEYFIDKDQKEHYKQLSETLAQCTQEFYKLIEDVNANGISEDIIVKTKKKKFIFNKDAFRKENDNLKIIFQLFETKPVKISYSDIKLMGTCLYNLLPHVNDMKLQQIFAKINCKNEALIKKYKQVRTKKEIFELKIGMHYFIFHPELLIDFSNWKLKENENKFKLLFEFLQKWDYLFESIKKIRKIEKIARKKIEKIDENYTSNFRVEEIISIFMKYFKNKENVNNETEYKDFKKEASLDDNVNTYITNKITTLILKFSHSDFLDDSDKSKIYYFIYDELDMIHLDLHMKEWLTENWFKESSKEDNKKDVEQYLKFLEDYEEYRYKNNRHQIIFP